MFAKFFLYVKFIPLERWKNFTFQPIPLSVLESLARTPGAVCTVIDQKH